MFDGQKYCQVCDEPVAEDKVPACPLACRSQKCKAYQVKDPINLSNKPVIWVLGGPGSGKGTQCKKMVAKYGFVHISTGELLEEEIKSGSSRARCLITVKSRGGLAPNDLVLSLLKDAIEKRADAASGIVIEGYPRERAQGVIFEQQIAPVTMIVFLDATEETMIKRLAGAAQAAQSKRIDENSTSLLLRLKIFNDNNNEVLSLHPTKLLRINANRTPDEMFAEIVRFLDPIVKAQKAQTQPPTPQKLP